MSKELKHTIHNYRADVDGLRALAILLVLFYHVFPSIVKGGFIGVDIFFVISGFLITGIILKDLKNSTFSFSSFFSRRIRRIFPVLLVVISSSLIAGWFLLLPKEFMELGKHVAGGVWYVANFTLWSDSGYFDALPELKPLLHLWSLSIEEQFYLIWPVALFFAVRKKKQILPLLIILLILSFAINAIYILKNSDLVFYFPFFRFWEILIGALLSLLLFEKRLSSFSTKKSNLISVIGLTLIIFATLKLTKYSLFPGWWALLPTLGTAMIIGAGNESWLNKNIFSNKIIVWIGLISYPLYLWHWPIFSFVFISVGELPHHLDKLIVLISSFLLAWISYRFIETPIRLKSNSKTIVRILLVTSIVIGVLGFTVFKLKGIPSRIHESIDDQALPIELKEMLDPNFGSYISKEWREHECFLAKNESVDKYSEKYIEKTQRPMVFLWGDSHAAALYSGLKALQLHRNFSLSQMTASACAPVLNWDGNINKLCREINDHIIELIKREKPDIVLLQAAWYWSEYDWKKTIETITELKKLKIRKIILIGPSPLWKEKVPNIIISYYRKYAKFPPLHTSFNVDINEISKIDQQLLEFSHDNGISFISIYQTLCNEQGCMLSIGDNIRNVSSLDSGHLSVSASEFVARALEAKIFEGIKQRQASY